MLRVRHCVAASALAGACLAQAGPRNDNADFRLSPIAFYTEAEQRRISDFLQALVRWDSRWREAPAATRSRHVLLNARSSPDFDANASSGRGFYLGADPLIKEVTAEPIPIFIAPRASDSKRILKDEFVGWDKLDGSTAAAATTYFEPFQNSDSHRYGCPVPSYPGQGPIGNPKRNAFVDVFQQGKVVTGLADAAKLDALLQRKRAERFGHLATARLTDGLFAYRTKSRNDKSEGWSIPIADANGIAHWSVWDWGSPGPIRADRGSFYENSLETELGPARIGRHSRLVQPVPIARNAAGRTPPMQERIVATSSILAQEPCLVLHAASTWQPLREDVVLRPLRSDELPENTRAIVLSLDASVADFIRCLGAYFGIEAEVDASTPRLRKLEQMHAEIFANRAETGR